MASAASSTCAAQRTSRGCRPYAAKASDTTRRASSKRSRALSHSAQVAASRSESDSSGDDAGEGIAPPACGPPARVFVAPLRPVPSGRTHRTGPPLRHQDRMRNLRWVRESPARWPNAATAFACLPCAWQISPTSPLVLRSVVDKSATARAAMSALPSASKSVARSRATSWSPGWSSRAFCKTKHASSARPIPPRACAHARERAHASVSWELFIPSALSGEGIRQGCSQTSVNKSETPPQRVFWASGSAPASEKRHVIDGPCRPPRISI